MPDPILEKLAELRAAIAQESCTPKDPFIKLGSGTAPALNYNIPQSSCFKMYGTLRVNKIPASAFIDAVKTPPRNNFFDRVSKLSEVELQQKFAEAVQLQPANSAFLPNNNLLRRNIDPAQTDFAAITTDMPQEGAQQRMAVSPEKPLPFNIVERASSINEVELARLAKQGQMPYVEQRFGGYRTRVSFLPKPPAVVPYFCVIEEYTTCSYLGDYGAGRTIKTFSLLPGEKTTISVRTYKDMESTRTHSENVLDSFSESSTEELENNIESETGYATSDTESSSTSDSTTKSHTVSGGFSVSLFKVLNIGANGGGGKTQTFASTDSASSTRASNVRSLNSALDKHIANSNSNRQIDVNTTTTDTAREGEETTTVRELVNYNKSRVLNFVFRQLLQEYVTITYLSNIKIVFCNGYAESLRTVDLEGLNALLADVCNPAEIENVRKQILKPYCTVFNWLDEEIEFIEPYTVNYGRCLGINEEETFYRRTKGVEDMYKNPDSGLEIKVKGPILHVSQHILRTSSVVVDALLGQGEALDCYNQKAQDAESMKGYLENMTMLQQIAALENIEDPAERAAAYKKIFGNCCDTPQVICGCGGNHSEGNNNQGNSNQI